MREQQRRNAWGLRFSTYAAWWVKKYVMAAIANAGRTIRLPAHVLEKIRRMRRVEDGLRQELGREPSPEEVARTMGISADSLLRTASARDDACSLEALGDSIEDMVVADPADAAGSAALEERVARAMGALDGREREVVRLFFGLEDGAGRTSAEVGAAVGVSPQYALVIRDAALKKLFLAGAGRGR